MTEAVIHREEELEVWQEYEDFKKRLVAENLSPEEYERRIKEYLEANNL